MRVVGIGNITVDAYYKDNLLVGIDGGKTTSNIIFNLSYFGNNTMLLGNVGNDEYGQIAIDSLNLVGVDTSNICLLQVKTRVVYVDLNKGISKIRCPICNNKYWYDDSNIKIKGINQDDIVVIDNLKVNIDKLHNRVMLDIGYNNELENMNDRDIINKINKIEILNLNERVEKYLLERFNKNLYELFKCKLIIVTRGGKGADFIYKNKIISNKIKNKHEEVDTTGAGDFFFAYFIHSYIKNRFNISTRFINRTFKECLDINKNVLCNIGARGYHHPLYKLDIKTECICKKR